MCHSIRYTWPNFFPLRFMSLFFLPLLSVFLFKENVRTNEVKKTRNVYEFLNDKTNWPRNEFSLHSSTNSSVSHFHFFSERTAPRQTGKYMTRKTKDDHKTANVQHFLLISYHKSTYRQECDDQSSKYQFHSTPCAKIMISPGSSTMSGLM